MSKSKRSRRDSPPSPFLSKRSRSTHNNNNSNALKLKDHDDDPENVNLHKSPEFQRSRSSSASHHNQGHPRDKEPSEQHNSSEDAVTRPEKHYRVLCISSLNPRASDNMIKDILHHQFKKFDAVSVKIVNEPEERLAYVYFRSYEDARDARHSSKSKILIYDKPVMIEKAYYESTSYEKPRQPEPEPDFVSPQNFGRNRFPPPFSRGGYPGGGSQRGFQDIQDKRFGSGPPYPYRPPINTGGPPPPPPVVGTNNPRSGPVRPQSPQPQIFASPGPRFPPGRPPGGMRCSPMKPYDQSVPVPVAPAPVEFENKRSKSKFPNYLNHINPEDDPLATRTLFVGNLGWNVTKEEMRVIFGEYGIVEDVDIKYPPPGKGSAFAFVRFANLDMAVRAKIELSGQYVGKSLCKIGYGKVNPTTTIWIGGLGHWTSLSDLEREFDRFGVIKKIEWNKGDTQAVITFEGIDAAKAAVKDMRGYPLGGPDKRIRTDFAGVEQIVRYADSVNGNDAVCSGQRPISRGSPGSNYLAMQADVTPTPSPTGSPNSEWSLAWNGSVSSPNVKNSTISRMTQGMSVAWQGTLVLKKNSFAVELLYTKEGGLKGIDGLMPEEKDEAAQEDIKQLIFSRKLPLRQYNLERLKASMLCKKNSADVFLAIPGQWNRDVSPVTQNESPLVHGHLRELVKYFKDKEAGGIIVLKNKELRRRIMYGLPPCEFSHEILKKSMPDFEVTQEQEDYLVIVAITSDWDGKD